MSVWNSKINLLDIFRVDLKPEESKTEVEESKEVPESPEESKTVETEDSLLEKTDRSDIKVEVGNIYVKDYFREKPYLDKDGNYFQNWLIGSDGEIWGIDVGWDHNAKEFTHAGADKIMNKIAELIAELREEFYVRVVNKSYHSSTGSAMAQGGYWKNIVLIKHAKLYSSIKTKHKVNEDD